MILWSLGRSNRRYIVLLEALFFEVTTKNYNYFLVFRESNRTYASPKVNQWPCNKPKFPPNCPIPNCQFAIAGLVLVAWVIPAALIQLTRN